ncbi:MAG TPA: 4Fe-4S dicluster domain-containing protein [Candidatus Sulfotelmatobacter sp.]|nr:4Fe-4S dicluster domain-containing protein [Candidatus Sulfotelmatobacter sp.]
MVAESVMATRETPHKGAVSLENHVVFAAAELATLISLILRAGYELIGPTVRDGAVVYAPIQSAQDLPQGWTDEQNPASYRLKPRPDDAYFGYTLGPQSWKKYLHPSQIRLWSAERKGSSFRILNNESRPKSPLAFLGVRACELAAIRLQDRVFLEDRYRDPVYDGHRSGAFLIAVQCTQSTATCFCSSMGTGPAVLSGADLVLIELRDGGKHRFLARVDSERGEKILGQLKITAAKESDLDEAEAALHGAASVQKRAIDNTGIRELLYQYFEHPHWEAVAARCLGCANCTLVCPTCFCTTVEDVSDVTGQHAERWRKWDSCFTQTFSYIHGGSVRTSGKARYRQWITHKLAAWQDQFGASGCVGCGRCITWCPVGIDITEEVRSLREGDKNGNS